MTAPLDTAGLAEWLRAAAAEDVSNTYAAKLWAAADALTAKDSELAEARALARRLSDALLTVRPLGGSELFMRVGEDFYADPAVCGAEIAKLRGELHRLKAEVALSRARTVLSRQEASSNG